MQRAYCRIRVPGTTDGQGNECGSRQCRLEPRRGASYALALLFLALLMVSPVRAARPVISALAEHGQLIGVKVAKVIPGFRGHGYVTGFVKPGDRLILTLHVPQGGLYAANIRYSAPDQKGFSLTVNGSPYSSMFPPSPNHFSDFNAGLVELKTGKNVVSIGRGWGFFSIDSVTFTPARPPPPPMRPSPKLSDPDATPQARSLMRHLVGVYGRKMLTGVYGGGDARYVHGITGQYPAIIGGDLIDYSPTRIEHGANPHHAVQKLINEARKGFIITLSWHWNAPAELIDHNYINARGKKITSHWWSGFYTKSTKFNIAQVLAHPNSKNYRLMIGNIDAIAVQLKKFDNAGIPVLWRPLHEASGGWFWWGAHGPGPFKQLWRLLYDRLTLHFHLHNLIWVYTTAGTGRWYPGNQYVDIVGVDQYPKNINDPLSSLWQNCIKHFPGKLVAMTEFGGVVNARRAFQFGVYWDYEVSWFGRVHEPYMRPSALKNIYNQKNVLTHAEVKNW
jgi:mannan endo-1,4-beta-mannosidase